MSDNEKHEDPIRKGIGCLLMGMAVAVACLGYGAANMLYHSVLR